MENADYGILQHQGVKMSNVLVPGIVFICLIIHSEAERLVGRAVRLRIRRDWGQKSAREDCSFSWNAIEKAGVSAAPTAEQNECCGGDQL